MEKRFDFERLVELCRRTHQETRRTAARAIDRSLVVRNWLFGWYIVEYEQSGEDRAEYGAQTLKRLSAALKERIGRGFSLRSLEQFRRFYLQSEEILPQAGKTQTLSAISAAAQNPQTPSAKSTASGGGMSQALRSASATLIHRLPLGWSHYEVRRLAREGQVVEKASDLIKDPVVLEFLGLERTPAYSESDLKTAIIDRLHPPTHPR